jgi:hypothetical protein
VGQSYWAYYCDLDKCGWFHGRNLLYIDFQMVEVEQALSTQRLLFRTIPVFYAAQLILTASEIQNNGYFGVPIGFYKLVSKCY